MYYNSFFFLWTFPLVFAFYWLTTSAAPAKIKTRAGNVCLLTLSYLILGHENAMSCLWLAYVTVTTFLGARYIGAKRLPLFAVVTLAVMPLAVLKYYDFACSVLSDIGLHVSSHSLLVPLGISFFTLQAVGYVVDVYRGDVKPEEGLLDYSLFIAFFPQIVAGPISRYSKLMPQIKGQRTFDDGRATEGLRMLLWGMFLKTAVADRLALFVNDTASYLEFADGSTLLSMVVQYSVQIYCDFAGYSLMAIGTAKAMGFDLADNFRRPYLAVSVSDFWHRWHISLSSWLRDYVYISLGGNRCSRWRSYVNIVITFTVSGIWHGANYTFIVWGLLHGLCLCVEKRLGLNKRLLKPRIVKAARIVLTFCLISLLWVVFRMPTLEDAYCVLAKILACADLHLVLPDKYITAMLLLVAAKDIVDEYCPQYALMHNRHRAVRWSAYVCIATLIILFGVFDSGQFIYAKF